MRSSLIFMIFLAGCTTAPGGWFPTPAQAEQSAALEVLVKTEFPAIIADIQSGGGPALTRAFDASGVPAQDRATRAFQLNSNLGLYANNPGALISALNLYGTT